MNKFEDIYVSYFDVVYKYLYSLTKNKELSEDLTQDTFFKAIMKIDTFKNKSKLSTWLCQIAKNLWYDELKKQNRKIDIDEGIDLYNLENTVILNEEKYELRGKINKLDPITREVMCLRIYGELSFSEIGIIKGKTENWARVTFYRGKNKLKKNNFDK